MEKVIIVGAGGFGREVKMLIDQINYIEKKYLVIGFVDDIIQKGTTINGIEVLGNINYLLTLDYKVNLVIAIGDPKIKIKLINSLINDNFNFPTLIHPNVQISNDDVFIGKGCIICSSCILTVNIQIHDFVIFNLLCTVGHDTSIGSFSSFMPAVNISGEVEIKNGVYIGTGAKVINQVSIGENTIIGAGSIVIKSIPSNCTAVGIPAKPIK